MFGRGTEAGNRLLATGNYTPQFCNSMALNIIQVLAAMSAGIAPHDFTHPEAPEADMSAFWDIVNVYEIKDITEKPKKKENAKDPTPAASAAAPAHKSATSSH
jgi:hypothetical protein